MAFLPFDAASAGLEASRKSADSERQTISAGVLEERDLAERDLANGDAS